MDSRSRLGRTAMPAPLTPGGDPRLARLLERLPDLGVPVLPLDFVRIARVLPPGRTLEWSAARELLVTLLAKDEAGRATVRREFRRYFPPQERPTPTPGTAPAADPAAPDADPDPDQDQARPPSPIIVTPPRRPWPLWRLTLGAILAVGLGLAGLFLAMTWRPPEPAAPPVPPSAPTPQTAPPLPGTLPAVPLPTFNDWVPIFAPPDTAELLARWLPPLGLLGGGLLALAWLGQRAWRLQTPPGTREVRFAPDGEPVFTWSAADLDLPQLLDARQRRELVWGVQRFASEHSTPRLDIADTVAASARCGFPVPRFARACPEREVWLWLDTRLRSPPAVALADQVERDLTRAGLRVRRATFAAVPDLLRLATGERAAPLDLGAAARQALVCVFTDGLGLARALDAPADARPDDGTADRRRALRELRTWPRLCLVDFAAPEVDLPALAGRLGLTPVAPDALPAWLAERPHRPPPDPEPPPTHLALRLWAAACALPRLPITGPQARTLYQALAEPLGLPPAWDLPDTGADGPRFTDEQRQALLRDLARWVWEDGWRPPSNGASIILPTGDGPSATGPGGSGLSRDRTSPAAVTSSRLNPLPPGPGLTFTVKPRPPVAGTTINASDACRCLATALAYWDQRLKVGAEHLERLAGQDPAAPRWQDGPGDQARTIEGLLLDLWWGDARTADAVRGLYDIWQQAALRPLIRERLRPLRAHGLPDDDRSIRLPWTWQALPEATDADGTPEPRDTARRRLQRMGFADHAPGGRRALGAETLIALGAAAGLALAGLIGVAQRLGAGTDGGRAHDAAVYEGALFRRLVMEGQQGGRHYAASRKLTATTAATGTAPPLHWCWSGLEANQAAPACRGLYRGGADPRQVNPLPLGQGALLRAGTLAEPIRACAPDWPALSVAVIAGDRWDWPKTDKNNEAARRLAIRLLDRGAADLVIIGPDWAEQARRLAADWGFVADGQWLFFAQGSGGVPPNGSAGVPPAKQSEPQVPTLGAHRALLTGDLEAMASALDFPGARPAAAALGRAARVTTLAGTPRLWGGPEVETGPQGIPFVHVCPGTFTMGSPAAGADTPEHLKPYDDELPAHPVILDGFWIARTETTQAQYAALGGATASTGANQPVAEIDWTQADTACQHLVADAGLPTEAQWEYAARGGSQTPYPLPSDLAGLCNFVNGAGNENPDWDWRNKACADPFKGAAPAGQFPANPLGLYDMHGNLWEWVRDCWDNKVYAGRGAHPTAAPFEDSRGCGGRVLRGGSFDHEPRDLRSADRFRDAPLFRNGYFGFRCVRGAGRPPNP